MARRSSPDQCLDRHRAGDNPSALDERWGPSLVSRTGSRSRWQALANRQSPLYQLGKRGSVWRHLVKQAPGNQFSALIRQGKCLVNCISDLAALLILQRRLKSLCQPSTPVFRLLPESFASAPILLFIAPIAPRTSVSSLSNLIANHCQRRLI